MRFTQARNYHAGRIKKVRLIVVHSTEGNETEGSAWGVAQWFAGASAPQASAHYIVDDKEVVQGVKNADTAWAAPGANADGLQIEHVGRAAQSRGDWTDVYSRAVLSNSAKLAAGLAKQFGIPVKHLSNTALAAGLSGFVGHAQVTEVYKQSDHTDPGPGFPWDVYLAMVQAEYDALAGKPRTKAAIAALAAVLGVAVAVFGGVTQTPTPAPKPSQSHTASPSATTAVVHPVPKPAVKPVPKPSPQVYIKVKSGDTMSVIAANHRMTLGALLRLNPSIHNPALIFVGQRVRVK